MLDGMSNEEAILWLVSLAEHKGEQLRICAEDAKALQMGIDAIKALEQEPITWIVGKDNCQVAVRNMPIDKMQKICAIIREEEQQPCKEYDYKALWSQVEWERDVAVEQLEQLGYSLGEKIRTSEDCISREDVLRHRHVVQNNDWIGCSVVRVEEIKKLPSVTPKQPFINKPCISEGVCHEDKVKVLEKVRAEIIELRSRQNVGVLECLDIIDEYIAEEKQGV